MEKSAISVATMTWARDAFEEGLLREAMSSLAAEQLPVVITDGGSGRELINYLSGFSNFKVFESDQPGVFAQSKWSLKHACDLGAEYLLYTEPDKKLFFEHRLGEFISEAPNDDQVGVALPSRTVESFSTYPESQRYTETVINQLCARIIGEGVDLSYGTLLINRALIPYLDLVKEDIGWGWRHYVLGVAHRLGYKIAHLEMDLPCPPEQQEDDRQELIHRMRQLAQNVQGLLLSATISLDHSD